ncbi:hypothetical protein CRU96_02645 [Malaciobacter halophilus]|nr:GTPase [Malaciobacter halophilus]RYA24550.1 hypothetical protein CRU96_02645 [Malaciobacter halophilus]
MSKYQNNAIKEKYLSTGDINILKDLKSAIKENSLIVTCMGLYNHGKSTLLNTLIKDFEYKTFKTADVRETSTNKTIKHGNIKFIDTPGLNAKKHDDKRVMDAIKESDINIFVHTVTTGEFVEKEIEFLNNVKKYWKDPKEFCERTIFVVSRVDKANTEDDIANTIEKMSNQINEIFNYTPTIIPVSAMRYTKGIVENKKLMVKKSKIEVLKKELEILSDKLSNSIKKTRKKRVEKKYDDLIKQLSSKVQMNKLEISKQKKAQEKYLHSLNSDIKNIENTLSNMYSKLGA